MDPRTVVDLVLEFEDEVNNGGLHRFFNNSSGDNITETNSRSQNDRGHGHGADILTARRPVFQTVCLPRLGMRDWPRGGVVFRKPTNSEIWMQHSSPTRMICLACSRLTKANFPTIFLK